MFLLAYLSIQTKYVQWQLVHPSYMWPALAKAGFWEKISFADFSLVLIKKIISDQNVEKIIILSLSVPEIWIFLMLSYSKLQFRENRMQSWLIQIEILSSACVVVYLEFAGTTKAKRPNEVIFRKLSA